MIRVGPITPIAPTISSRLFWYGEMITEQPARPNKWLCAPKGSAFLYTHPQRQHDLHPTTISHGLAKGYLEEFDWTGTRTPYIVATENDSLNGAGMLFGYLLTNTAQVFADVRTYWSAAAVKRVTGHKLTGAAAGGFLHLINSGPAALDGTGEQSVNGRPAMTFRVCGCSAR